MRADRDSLKTVFINSAADIAAAIAAPGAGYQIAVYAVHGNLLGVGAVAELENGAGGAILDQCNTTSLDIAVPWNRPLITGDDGKLVPWFRCSANTALSLDVTGTVLAQIQVLYAVEPVNV